MLIIVTETGNKEATSLPLSVASEGGGRQEVTGATSEDGATGTSAPTITESVPASSCSPLETVDIKVIYNKTKYDVSVCLEFTVGELKRQLMGLLGVPEKNQKVMFKGLLRDEQTLTSAGVIKGSKLMVVGSKPNDIIAVTSVRAQEVQELERPTASKEPLCKQKIHKKILDKGVPEDAMPGIKNNKVRYLDLRFTMFKTKLNKSKIKIISVNRRRYQAYHLAAC